jgi:hypothetical protein
MKLFGSDLGKYLKNAGFDVKFLNGEISPEQRKNLNESKGIVALDVYQNDTMQTLNLHFNPTEFKKIESVVNKFQFSNYDGPVLSRNWTSKQVKGAINPGDICKQGKGENGKYTFYRLAQVDTKVVNK